MSAAAVRRAAAAAAVGRAVDDGARLAHELVRQHDGRRLQRLGQLHRPLRGRHAVGDRGRRQHQARRVAVQAADGERQVALLALGRDAGGRAAAHHVDDHDRHLGGDRQADGLGHQRQARAGGGGQRRHAADTTRR